MSNSPSIIIQIHCCCFHSKVTIQDRNAEHPISKEFQAPTNRQHNWWSTNITTVHPIWLLRGLWGFEIPLKIVGSWISFHHHKNKSPVSISQRRSHIHIMKLGQFQCGHRLRHENDSSMSLVAWTVLVMIIGTELCNETTGTKKGHTLACEWPINLSHFFSSRHPMLVTWYEYEMIWQWAYQTGIKNYINSWNLSMVRLQVSQFSNQNRVSVNLDQIRLFKTTPKIHTWTGHECNGCTIYTFSFYGTTPSYNGCLKNFQQLRRASHLAAESWTRIKTPAASTPRKTTQLWVSNDQKLVLHWEKQKHKNKNNTCSRTRRNWTAMTESEGVLF